MVCPHCKGENIASVVGEINTWQCLNPRCSLKFDRDQAAYQQGVYAPSWPRTSR